MKLVTTLVIGALLAGCRHVEMTSTDSEGKQTIYSAYYQNDRPTVAGKVIVDAIITLGPERLPKNYRFEERPSYSDGQVEAVLEIYFKNITDRSVDVQIQDYVFSWYGGQLGPKIFTIPSKGYIKSDPNIRIVSNYMARPYEYSLHLLVDGAPVELKGVMRRLPVTELNDKYKN